MIAFVFAGVSFLSWAESARCEIVVQGYYRFGENDGSVSSGQSGTSTTGQTGGSLTSWNYNSGALNTTYSNNIANTAVTATGSTLSMNFGGNQTQFYRNGNLASATSNWGIEGWFRVTNNANRQMLAYNGQSVDSGLNGFGLMVDSDGRAKGLINGLSGTVLDSGFSVTNNQWFYFAMVRDGTSNKLYVNNTTAISAGTAANNAASAWFTVGGSNNTTPTVNDYCLTGGADEVRLFTIGAGGFDANRDLLIAPAVPEPGTLLLGGIAAACGGGGVWWKRRKLSLIHI